MKGFKKTEVSSIVPSNWPIEELTELSAQDCINLKNHEITTTLELLNQVGSKAKREELARQLSIPVQSVNKLSILAELARIPAVGCQYAEFLLQLGICSTEQLAQISLGELQKQVARFQVKILHRADLCPNITQIANWIQQAQQLMAQNPIKG